MRKMKVGLSVGVFCMAALAGVICLANYQYGYDGNDNVDTYVKTLDEAYLYMSKLESGVQDSTSNLEIYKNNEQIILSVLMEQIKNGDFTDITPEQDDLQETLERMHDVSLMDFTPDFIWLTYDINGDGQKDLVKLEMHPDEAYIFYRIRQIFDFDLTNSQTKIVYLDTSGSAFGSLFLFPNGNVVQFFFTYGVQVIETFRLVAFDFDWNLVYNISLRIEHVNCIEELVEGMGELFDEWQETNAHITGPGIYTNRVMVTQYGLIREEISLHLFLEDFKVMTGLPFNSFGTLISRLFEVEMLPLGECFNITHYVLP